MLYGTGEQVEPGSAADARALEKTRVHIGKRNDVVMLWAGNDIEVKNNYSSTPIQLKALVKRLTEEKLLKEKNRIPSKRT